MRNNIDGTRNDWPDQENEPQAASAQPPDKKRGRSAKDAVDVFIGDKDFATIVSDSIVALQEKLSALQLKPTLAEYLKLLELAKDLRVDDVRKEIQIQWIDPPKSWSDEE
jgi:hypothetical protein